MSLYKKLLLVIVPVVALVTLMISHQPPLELDKTYTNNIYSYSIRYPSKYEAPDPDEESSFLLGDKIRITHTPNSPDSGRPLSKPWERVKIGNNNAVRLRNTQGAIGGNIPQEYLRYDFVNGQKRVHITLYSFPFNATASKTFYSLKDEDIKLFERIVSTFEFTD